MESITKLLNKCLIKEGVDTKPYDGLPPGRLPTLRGKLKLSKLSEGDKERIREYLRSNAITPGQLEASVLRDVTRKAKKEEAEAQKRFESSLMPILSASTSGLSPNSPQSSITPTRDRRKVCLT